MLRYTLPKISDIADAAVDFSDHHGIMQFIVSFYVSNCGYLFSKKCYSNTESSYRSAQP